MKNLTVQHEQSTINACMRWLFKRGETQINSFEFQQLQRIDRGNEANRRATLTNDEYQQLYRAVRSYYAKTNRKVNWEKLVKRKLVQHYVLIVANSGLRVGEQLQLKWG